MGWAREGGKGDGEPFQVKNPLRFRKLVPRRKRSTGGEDLYRGTNPLPGDKSTRQEFPKEITLRAESFLVVP